jgi:hypothetical protein
MDELRARLAGLRRVARSSSQQPGGAPAERFKLDLTTAEIQPLWGLDTDSRADALELLFGALRGTSSADSPDSPDPAAPAVLVDCLDLMFLELGAEGMQDLCGALKSPAGLYIARTVQTLGLGCNRLGQPGAPEALASLLSTSACGNLTHLFLFKNSLGDRGTSLLCDALRANDAPRLVFLVRFRSFSVFPQSACSPPLSLTPLPRAPPRDSERTKSVFPGRNPSQNSWSLPIPVRPRLCQP